jgi:alkaline phosphatase
MSVVRPSVESRDAVHPARPARWLGPALTGALAALLLIAATGGSAPAQEADAAPRDVILMIADGCGFASVEAASYFATGEARSQIYWDFPVALAMSTYAHGGHYDPERAWSDVDWLRDDATDSAAAVTALTTGTKTVNKRLAVGPDGEPLTTLVEAFERTGRATGLVSSVMITHATPAGWAISHENRNEYEEIGTKLLLGSAIDVVMGPGHPDFCNDSQRRDEPRYRYVGGEATWRAVLGGEPAADADGDGVADRWVVLESPEQLAALARASDPPRRVLAVPRVHTTLQSKRGGDRDADAYTVPFTPGVPTLQEMTLAALNVLQHDPDGFGLMIEGGAVDWAGHDKLPGRLIEEQHDFDVAVEAVVGWIDARGAWDSTLLVVTSDHECGHVCGPDDGTALPPVEGRGAGQMPHLEIRTGKHTNALVPFFARGAGAERFVSFATGRDPVRGAYLDNADVGRYLQQLARSPRPTP